MVTKHRRPLRIHAPGCCSRPCSLRAKAAPPRPWPPQAREKALAAEVEALQGRISELTQAQAGLESEKAGLEAALKEVGAGRTSGRVDGWTGRGGGSPGFPCLCFSCFLWPLSA